ncbi:MAG: hypothetical protein Q7L07_12795 [Pseudohongiella sp.]|nr:hypothetical protein [Pseudohongiella sp.]
MTLMTDTDSELLTNGVWFSRLESMAFTEISGIDSKRFLQGQLSCNVLKLDENTSLRGALCSLKGRVIADLRLVEDADKILMLSRLDLQEKVLTTLNKYRVFFKTSLAEVNTKYFVCGIGGSDIEAIVSKLDIQLPVLPDTCTHCQEATFIKMPTTSLFGISRYLVVFPRSSEQAVALSLRLQQTLVELPEQLWTVADIRTGQAHPDLEQSEVFTPQLLNYDVNGVIDFKKGCYTGQEIVARMFYKADAKRRLFYVSSDLSDAAIQDNQLDVPTEDVVVSVKFENGRQESLVVLNCEQAKLMPSVIELS